MSETTGGRLRATAWAVGTAIATALILWLSSHAGEAYTFESSLRWRVPRAEQKIKALEDLQGKKHEEIMSKLNEILQAQKDLAKKETK